MSETSHYSIELSRAFLRRSAAFFRKHPDLIETYERVVDDLREDPFMPRLRTHPLRGKLTGQYGVSLTYAYRLIVTVAVIERVVVLLDIGTHDDVYRRD